MYSTTPKHCPKAGCNPTTTATRCCLSKTLKKIGLECFSSVKVVSLLKSSCTGELPHVAGANPASGPSAHPAGAAGSRSLPQVPGADWWRRQSAVNKLSRNVFAKQIHTCRLKLSSCSCSFDCCWHAIPCIGWSCLGCIIRCATTGTYTHNFAMLQVFTTKTLCAFASGNQPAA